MARPLRINYPGAFYHVTCRGNERKNIFGDDRDWSVFLDKLKTSVAIYQVRVHAYDLEGWCLPSEFAGDRAGELKV